jgi:hypothetical protein
MTGRGKVASRYINNQKAPDVSGIPWGRLGNTGENGCGWIAIYNIMASYDVGISKDDVLRDLSARGGALLWGKLGTSPTAITGYLRSEFAFVRIAAHTAQWGALGQQSERVIILFRGKGRTAPLHYVAGVRTMYGTESKFRFYNDPCWYGRKYRDRPISIREYAAYLTECGCMPLLLWGIAGRKA